MTHFILIISGLQCARAAIVVVDGWIDLLVSSVISYIDVCFWRRGDMEFFGKRSLGEMKRGVCDPIRCILGTGRP